MEQLLEKNPAETFLIEGHTDAVGSDVANLALSDRRAEAVADALTNVFGIPPENLATQGYGERYLKVKTDGAGAAEPPRRDPPHHAAGRAGGQRQLRSRPADPLRDAVESPARSPHDRAGFPALSLGSRDWPGRTPLSGRAFIFACR